VSTSVDICVVGGGPAGAVTAIELMRLGFSVHVIDAGHAKVHWPEVASPTLIALAEKLGILPALAHAVVGELSRKIVLTSRPRPSDDHAGAGGWVLDRARLAAALRTAAISNGILFSTGTAGRVLGCEGALEVPVLGSPRQAIIARQVVLAGGRRTPGPGRLQLLGDRRVTFYGVADSNLVPVGTSIFEDGRDEWSWAVALPDGLHILTSTSAGGSSPEAALDRAFQPYRRNGPARLLRATDSSLRAADEPLGDGWIRVGDALVAPSPLASNGLYCAVVSGVQAARVLNTRMRAGERSQIAAEFYRNLQAASVRSSRAAANRGANANEGTFVPPAIAITDAGEFFLRAGVALTNVPVLQGDLIDTAPALICRSGRAVAFVDAFPVAELIRPLVDGQSLATAIGQWRRLSAETCSTFASLLIAEAFVCPRGSCTPEKKPVSAPPGTRPA
jgi:flavin-dependent dehydrogenase